MKTPKLIWLVCLIVLAASGTVVAQDNSKKKSKPPGKTSSAATPVPGNEFSRREEQKAGAKIGVVITPSERETIRAYCVQFEQTGKKGKKAKSLPPGLAKKVARGSKLPPGWEKKLVKGEVLPEPVFKACRPLPREVVVKLPIPPPETILRAIEGRIVRLHEKTREILDVFDPFN